MDRKHTIDRQTILMDISNNSVIITEDGEYRITGKSTINTITVVAGVKANIILENLYIDVSHTYKAAFLIADGSTGNVNLKLVGDNVLKSGYGHAGLEKNGIEDVGTLTIAGTGSLTAFGGAGGAGIGGGGYTVDISSNGMFYVPGSSAGNIFIRGGTITAIGGKDGAGIGGGGGIVDCKNNQSNVVLVEGGIGRNIVISGGTITAIGGNGKYGSGAGIGGGNAANSDGNLSIVNGNAVIFATGGMTGDKKLADAISGVDSLSGVVFEGDSGRVYGSHMITTDVKVPENKTLSITSDQTLTIGPNTILTNDGIIENQGTIEVYGTLSGILLGDGKVNYHESSETGEEIESITNAGVFTISFHAGEGSGFMPDSIAVVDMEFPLPDCDFLPPSGKIFAGWAIGEADSENRAAVGEICTFTEDTTIYALWKDEKRPPAFENEENEETAEKEPTFHTKSQKSSAQIKHSHLMSKITKNKEEAALIFIIATTIFAVVCKIIHFLLGKRKA